MAIRCAPPVLPRAPGRACPQWGARGCWLPQRKVPPWAKMKKPPPPAKSEKFASAKISFRGGDFLPAFRHPDLPTNHRTHRNLEANCQIVKFFTSVFSH